MHFTWDISLGQIIIGIPVLGLLGFMLKIYSVLLRFNIEHETLMTDWGQRQTPPVKPEDFPTRRKRTW